MKHCIACGHSLPETALFTLKQAPASAQDIPDRETVEELLVQLKEREAC